MTNEDNLVAHKSEAMSDPKSDVLGSNLEPKKDLEEATIKAESEQQNVASSDETSELSIYDALLKQTENIQAELEKLNNHKLVHTYNSIPRLMWFSLLKGISLGLGSVLGATVVLSTLVYLLSQMEFIPIIGEWISAILDVVKEKPDN
ncbi:DUF5665 domain-containing protein [Psychrosphaera sp. 1_MG-2023]|uniref:DUF5665 domain-containing protein n=1 Tax=Psychrosphaera sp. 1_MG-2023 TaxID=3062643 RepID=UPI0026E2601E|nr:DUF5665 domain-containing protein [Psychrosphaera sp. 1_MG-2023]MDO6721026.1 DUF5665 domain-containing protein [Psychrosphaera sp. 1_MG-2023]